MYTLEDVRNEYDRLDTLLGIDTKKVQLAISKRALRRLGCFKAPKVAGTFPLCITLSSGIMDDDTLFWDTIRHEYAHAAVYLLYPDSRHGHDRLWKAMCARVGCSGKRLAEDNEPVQNAKYIVRCTKCLGESRYYRRGKVINAVLSGRGNRLVCKACGGRSFELIVNE